jgi:hypothetical protein
MNFIRRFLQLDSDFKLIFVGLLFFSICLFLGLRAKPVPALPSPTPDIAVVQQEMQKIVDEIGKIMVLPADETPTLATVTDPEVLRNQPFFDKALVGDKVLIYTKAKRAMLWRPDSHKIIEVSELATNEN